MQVLILNPGVSAAAVAAQAGIALSGATPWKVGFQQVGKISFSKTVTGAPVVLIQTAPDNATWTTVFTSDGTTTDQEGSFVLDAYIRVNVTVAGGAGTLNFLLLGSV